MKIPGPIQFEPRSGDWDAYLPKLRKVAGVYVLTSGGVPLHLSWSTNLERRLQRLLQSASPALHRTTRRLGEMIDRVECWPTGSRLELHIVLYQVARRLYPDRYLKFLKLRLPWFTGLVEDDAFARLESTNRLPAKWGLSLGPFASRASAQQYEAEALSLFQLRRCTEVLTPSPEHLGCIYGEMNQCLRPCQCAVSEAEYATEAARVRDFLKSNGRGIVSTLSSARERACDDMQFEQAAQLHKRIEKVKSAASLRDPVIGDVRQFSGLALTKAVEKGHFTLWPMWKGRWQAQVPLAFLNKESNTKSLDSELRELLSRELKFEESGGDPVEEIAIFARWYYSSWRDGEWFPFADLSNLNYRKLVRELSKMAQASMA